MAINFIDSLSIDALPRECIEECGTGQGYGGPAVSYWRGELGFTVNRDRAISLLGESSIWTRASLEAASDATIAGYILWWACEAFAQHLQWALENPEHSSKDSPYGGGTFAI